MLYNLNMDAVFFVLEDLFKYLLPAIGLTLLIGIVSWPFYALFFKKLWDKGLVLSIATAWVFVAFLYFELALVTGAEILTFKHSIIFLLLWAVFNAFLEYKHSKVRKTLKITSLAPILFLFAGAFIVTYLIKGHLPDSFNQERLMEFGITNSLFNSNKLPLQDFWMAGENLNYYYFGHFVTYFYLQILGMRADPALYVVSINLITSIILLTYYISSEISKGISKQKHYIGGLLGVFFVCLAGTIDTLPWLASKLFAVGNVEYYSHRQTAKLVKDALFLHPFRSFIDLDLHSHVWGILPLVAMILAVYYYMQFKQTRTLVVMAVILSVALLLHPWDYPVLALLAAIAILYKERNLLKAAFISFVVVYSAQIISSPFYSSYINPVSELGLVKTPSELMPWLTIWGVFIISTVVFLYLEKRKGISSTETRTITYVLFIASLILLLAIETFYVKDVNVEKSYYRFNTFYKTTSQVWVMLGICTAVAFTRFALLKSRILKIAMILVVFVMGTYFVTSVNYLFRENSFKGFRYLHSWWQKSYPYDYDAFKHLENLSNTSLKRKPIVIVEAYGDSYSQNNLFSALLGWNSILGWEEHEETWRNDRTEIELRQNLVDEIYIGIDPLDTQEMIDYYKINYIILGQVERSVYKNELNYEKIINLGEVEFFNNQTIVVKTTPRIE